MLVGVEVEEGEMRTGRYGVDELLVAGVGVGGPLEERGEKTMSGVFGCRRQRQLHQPPHVHEELGHKVDTMIAAPSLLLLLHEHDQCVDKVAERVGVRRLEVVGDEERHAFAATVIFIVNGRRARLTTTRKGQESVEHAHGGTGSVEARERDVLEQRFDDEAGVEGALWRRHCCSTSRRCSVEESRHVTHKRLEQTEGGLLQ